MLGRLRCHSLNDLRSEERHLSFDPFPLGYNANSQLLPCLAEALGYLPLREMGERGGVSKRALWDDRLDQTWL